MLNGDTALERLAADPSRTGIFTDFDGTLSTIVDHPDDALPVSGAQDALEQLATVFRLVGVVSGRSLDDLRSRFAPAGVLLAGSYGREKSDRPVAVATRDWEAVAIAAETGVHGWDGTIVERKDTGVAIHYRLEPERGGDVDALAAALAGRFGLEVRRGRMVAELTERGPGKAESLKSLLDEYGIDVFAFAGDDVADGEVFSWARASECRCVLIGVCAPESPPVIERESDILLDSPAALVALFSALAARVRRRG